MSMQTTLVDRASSQCKVSCPTVIKDPLSSKLSLKIRFIYYIPFIYHGHFASLLISVGISTF